MNIQSVAPRLSAVLCCPSLSIRRTSSDAYRSFSILLLLLMIPALAALAPPAAHGTTVLPKIQRLGDKPDGTVVTVGGVPAKASAARTDMSPDNILLIFVHGIDGDGFMQEGVFGTEKVNSYVRSNMKAMAAWLGLTLGSVDPYAPNALSATEYYGTEPPPYYDAQDIADLEATEAQYGGGIPSYALIVAKFARYRLEQSGASQLALWAHSMGGAVTRWIVEHDLEGLVSSGYLNRWIPCSGVIQGDIVTQWAPQLWMDTIGATSEYLAPEIHQLDPDWLDAQYGGDASVANNPLLSQILISEIRSTYPITDGKDLSFLFFGQPNDSVVDTKEMMYATVEDAAKWVTPSGEKVAPGVMESSVSHDDTIDAWSTAAHVAATLTGRRRVTVTLEELTASTIPDEGSAGEVFYDAEIWSPFWASTFSGAGLLQETVWEDRLEPPLKMRPGVPEYPESRIFDMQVMDEETSLELTMRLTEVDCFRHWGILENCQDENTDTDLGGVVISLPPESGDYVLRGANWGGIVRLEVREMW